MRPFSGTRAWLVGSLLCLAGSSTWAQLTWTAANPPTRQTLWGVAYGNGQFVAVGEGGTILSSSDGEAWSAHPGATAAWLLGVTYADSLGLWVAVGDGGVVLLSRNARTWSTASSPTWVRLNGVADAGDAVYVVGEQGTVLRTSDGRSWETIETGSSRWLRGIACGGPRVIVTGDSHLGVSIGEGRQFAYLPAPPNGGGSLFWPDVAVEAVAYGNGTFVAAGHHGRSWVIKADGATAIPIGDSQTHVRGLTYFDGQFVAVTADGSALSSPDGWTPWLRTPAASETVLHAVAASPDRVVAVGVGGTIVTSPPAPRAPRQTRLPLTVQASVGEPLALQAGVSGSAPLTYQWSRDGAAMPGEQAERLIIRSLSAADAGHYEVRVQNLHGHVTADVAQVRVGERSPPSVVREFVPPAGLGRPVDLVPLADGGALVASAAEIMIAGGSHRSVFRLRPDGSIDPTFRAGAGAEAGGAASTVTRLARARDGKVYVLGPFTTFNRVSRPRLVRLNLDGSVDLGFAPPAFLLDQIAQPEARGLAVDPEDRVLVSAGTVYRLHPDGSIDATFTPPASLGPVMDLALDRLQRIYVFSREATPNPEVHGRVLRLTPSGRADPTFQLPDHWGQLRRATLTPHDEGLYVNRDFGVFPLGNSFRANEAGLPDGRFPAAAFSNGRVTRNRAGYAAASDPDQRLWLAGTWQNGMSTSLITTYDFARYRQDGTRDESYRPRLDQDGSIDALYAAADGAVFAVGTFTSLGGQSRPGLAKLAAEAWEEAREAPPVLRAGPADQLVEAGSSTVLAVDAVGRLPLTYRWEREQPLPSRHDGPVWIEHPGTTASLRLDDIGPAAAGVYRVTVTDSRGQSSQAMARVALRPSIPRLASPLSDCTGHVGRNLRLRVAVSGAPPLVYQWYHDGTPVGENRPELVLSRLRLSDGGQYWVRVSNAQGEVQSEAFTLNVVAQPMLVNVATRAEVRGGEADLVVGFVLRGPHLKRLLIRGIGPALHRFEVPPPLLAQPMLQVFDAQGHLLRQVGSVRDSAPEASDFMALESAFRAVGAFELLRNAEDSALLIELPPGAYTAVVSAAANTSQGVALGEVYDADDSPTHLINLSTRAYVGTGGSVAIPGFVVQGVGQRQYLVRAVGPGLIPFGISDCLADPVIRVVQADGTPLVSNDDWGDRDRDAVVAASLRAGAFALAAGSRDAAVLVTLPAGNYTAIAEGKDGGTGVALVEVYEVPEPTGSP